MPADPVAIAADQALPFTERCTLRQCLGQVFYRFDLAQPRCQVDTAFDLFQQAAGQRRAGTAGQQQAQLALLQASEIKAAEIVHQHGLQIGAKHRFHGQLPARLHTQPFSQARLLLQALAM
ncbi:hypothetical protein D3C80_1448690 [compost metagenome]